jgi:hypothetical protein
MPAGELSSTKSEADGRSTKNKVTKKKKQAADDEAAKNRKAAKRAKRTAEKS